MSLSIVLTETGEARYRASVTAKLLERADRTDVPVGLGLDEGEMGDDERHQGPWVENYDTEEFPGTVHDDGLAALGDVVAAAAEPVTVISIGLTPCLAAAVEPDPDLAADCRFVGMDGRFYEGYGDDGPSVETNVRVDPDAFRTVLDAPWRDVLLTPLDTCGQLILDGERYNAVWSATDDPLVRSVVEINCIFAPQVP